MTAVANRRRLSNLLRVPDLDSLALLLEVIETGSLGRAAARHGISQPAVSARMAAMERLVGVPLLVRGTRGTGPTGAGSLLAGWAADVLAAAAALAAGGAALRADSEDRLRVAASLTVAEHLLPRWLIGLTTHRPDTSVSVTATNSAEVERAIVEGAADLGFVEGPDTLSGLVYRVIGRDELVLVVPPGHPWARRRRPVPASELAATRLVQREAASGTRTALERALAPYAPLPAPLLELSSTSAIVAAVAQGAGPAVLSTLAVSAAVRAGEVVTVPVTGADLTRQLRAVWRRGQRPSGPARDLLRMPAPR